MNRLIWWLWRAKQVAESIPNSPVHFSIPCSPTDSPLKRFAAFPKSHLLVLGPRRAKAIPSNGPNTYTSLSIWTSFGQRDLEITFYLEAIARSRPDVIIAPIDIEFGRDAPGVKRKDKMVERSTAWLRSFGTALKQAEVNELLPAAWVPILPLEAKTQRTYLQHLEEEGVSFIKGIVVYDSNSTLNVPESFYHLPLVSLTNPETPHDILRLIALGVDIVAAPFITAASEAGIALDFEFPARQSDKLLALGIDMWSEVYATQAVSLRENCTCYTCTNHHRAYIQHLLSAKEMLAWVLLQVHNHHVIDRFFEGIRESIARDAFEMDTTKFANTYQPSLPAFQGLGPRIRGYQASSGANAKKLNQAPFRKMGQSPSTRYDIAKENRSEDRHTKLVKEDIIEDFDFDALVNQLGTGDDQDHPEGV